MKTAITSAIFALAVSAIGITWAARDGSGNYSLPSGNPVSTGTAISSTWANTTLTDIATALTNSLSKDGQTVATANLPMGGFKHTSVADATARNQYATAAQVQDFELNTLSSVSGTDTIVGSLSPAITSYSTGMIVSFVPVNNNTGATTLAISGLTARDIVKWDGDALASGDLVAGVPAFLVVSSSQLLLINPQTVLTHVHSTSDVTSGTLAVARGGTGVTTSTGTGNVVLSASPTLTGTVTAATINATTLTGNGAGLTSLDAGDISAGTLPVARGGTGTTTSTGSGNVVLSASPTLTGTLSAATISATTVNATTVTGNGSGLTSLNAGDISAGTLVIARGGTGTTDGTARNITGKAGTTKTLSTSAPSGGSDGNIWYRY